MKGDWGTILYVVFLILFSVAGALNKKRKSEEELHKRRARQQAQAEEEPFFTGDPLVDALLGKDEEETGTRTSKEGKPAPREAQQGTETKDRAFYEKNQPVLSPEQEGRSALKKEEDNNRIVADHPDWRKFIREQQQEPVNPVLEDFDPVKAVIYSEIMERKYF